MLINIVSVGFPKNKHVQEMTDDYMNRIQQYIKIALKTVKQEPILTNPTHVVLKKEADRLVVFMKNSYNVVLDKDGEMMSSELFAKFLNKRIMNGTKVVNIIIGGPMGIDVSIKQSADKAVSLSNMTFPHELSMVIIAEQIYRAFAIIHGLPYHK